MNNLIIPNKLTRDPTLRMLMEKSGENLPLCLGRLLLLIDYHAKSEPRFYYHDQIDEIVQWTRYDLSYSELLEFAKLGEIEGKRFSLKLPASWLNANRRRMAGKRTAELAIRDSRGWFVNRKPERKRLVQLDAEGNEIARPT